jgi:hypothetical protein
MARTPRCTLGSSSSFWLHTLPPPPRTRGQARHGGTVSTRRPRGAARPASSAGPVGRGACSEAALGARRKRRARPRRDSRYPRRPRPGRDARRTRRLGRAGPSRRVQHRRPRPQAHAPRRTSPRRTEPTARSGALGAHGRGAPRGVAPVGTSHNAALCDVALRHSPCTAEARTKSARAVPPGFPPSAKHNQRLCYLPVGRRSSSARFRRTRRSQ